MCLPRADGAGAGRFWAATASLVAYVPMVRRAPRFLLQPKIGQPNASVIS